MMKYLPCAMMLLLVGSSLLLPTCSSSPGHIIPRAGLVLTQSATLQPGTYQLLGAAILQQPVLTIEGNNLTIDFDSVFLVGSDTMQRPDQFQGLAVLVKNGKHITIKNLRARGYQIGLMAENVDSLQLINCDLSYNYRPRLLSTQETKEEKDWLDDHQNDADEWLRYGAGIYLKNCRAATVRDCRVTQGQHGLLLTGCDDGLFYNNTFHFNSGLGIGLHRSSRNRVMHNRLDWNISGPSQPPGAAIALFPASNQNVVGFNSLTHSHTPILLAKMPNNAVPVAQENLFYRNDLSYGRHPLDSTYSRTTNIFHQNEYRTSATERPDDSSATNPPEDQLPDQSFLQPLADGMSTALSDQQLQGSSYILMNEWGPYNFAYPSIWLREVEDETYTFLLLGPAGNWKAVGGEGVAHLNPKTGNFPATLVVTKSKEAQSLSLKFEFIGEAVTDQFGVRMARGTVISFEYQ